MYIVGSEKFFECCDRSDRLNILSRADQLGHHHAFSVLAPPVGNRRIEECPVILNPGWIRAIDHLA
ncbi:MAG TPA: hypothetical protein VH165_33555, partial [Kofleriaceae bacterium]|nr:hypothetical protein [Kofleriaceae bacterium]